MANNYSQFSEVFTFKTAEAARMFMRLAEICAALHDGEIEPEDLEDLANAPKLEGEFQRMPGLWSYVTLDRRAKLLETFAHGIFDCAPGGDDPCSVWVSCEEWGNLDALGEVAHEVLAFCEDDTVLTLTWCDYCDKLRPGEFGGGWIVMSREGVDYGNAHDAARRAAKRSAANRKADKA